MSKLLSFKMRDDLFIETEKIIKQTHVARNAYINDAVEIYNKLRKRTMQKNQLLKESALVQKNSLETLALFEDFEEYGNLP